jgi:hypothetical protein
MHALDWGGAGVDQQADSSFVARLRASSPAVLGLLYRDAYPSEKDIPCMHELHARIEWCLGSDEISPTDMLVIEFAPRQEALLAAEARRQLIRREDDLSHA